MVTLVDIARKAGVSKSTVSRYLNGGSVSKETGAKIKKIIDETGYAPNRLAQSLKAENKNLIGIVIPRFDSTAMSLMMTGIDQLAYENNHQLLIMNSNLNPEREISNIKQLMSQKVAGIILIASYVNDELKQLLKTSRIPILVIGQRVEEITCVVQQDYVAGSRIAQVAHSLGHQRVGFIGVSTIDIAVGQNRRDGFIETAHQYGMEVAYTEASFSRHKTYHKMLEYLKDNQSTFIATATDRMAMGLLQACNDLGIRVPEDLSIAGFGGYQDTAQSVLGLSTIYYDYIRTGEVAYNHLLNLIEGRSTPLEIRLDFTLSENNTTKKIK